MGDHVGHLLADADRGQHEVEEGRSDQGETGVRWRFLGSASELAAPRPQRIQPERQPQVTGERE